MSNNIKTIYFCANDNSAETRLNLDLIYLSCLPQMSVSELRGIARESELRRWSTLKKTDLISFLKKHSFAIIESLHKRTLPPDTLRAWVRLFVTDKSVAEHYTGIILNTLARIGYFRTKRCRKKVSRLSLLENITADIDDEFTYNFITNVYNDSDYESEQ